jgi:hypothetical protein
VLKLVISGKSNLTRNKISLTIFVFAVLLIVGSITTQGVYAAPTVTLNPTSGPTGTTVHIYGSGFTQNGQIQTQLWNGTSTYSFTADATGSVNTTTVVPDVESGPYVFIVIDVSSQATTLTQFTVTQSSTSPSPTTTSSTSASPSPTPSVPELQLSVVVLILFIAISSLAISTVRKRKTVAI